MNHRLQPVQVAAGSKDQESRLVFHDGFLVAILIRLSEEHESDAGRWFLEAGFGQVDRVRSAPFTDLDEAQAWIVGQLSSHL